MLDEATVAGLARHWHDGWNGEDVEVIMAPFSEDIVFTSPFIGRVSDDPSRTSIAGWSVLRDYVDHALKRTPGIRYTLDGTYAGADAVVLVYTCHLPNGTTKWGADSMLVGDDGKVVEWRCHYTAESMGELR